MHVFADFISESKKRKEEVHNNNNDGINKLQALLIEYLQELLRVKSELEVLTQDHDNLTVRLNITPIK